MEESVYTRAKGVFKNTDETVSRKKAGNVKPVDQLFAEMQLSDDNDNESSSEAESDTVCPKCGLVYSDSGGLWVCCDRCNQWFDVKCTNIFLSFIIVLVTNLKVMHTMTYSCTNDFVVSSLILICDS